MSWEPSAGVLLYPKPAGVTSHDVVARVRRRLSEQAERRVKVGHAGTLDPFATGVLLVLVGSATRAQRFLMGLPKTYRALARLGWTSDTGDRDGALEHTGRVPESLAIPTGELLQVPPAYSAVKVGGERLYRKARRGEFVQADARPVTVYRADLLRHDGEHALFEIECSSGTYVRTLIADLGDAYCEELERTAIGPFRLEDASEDRVIPLNEALSFLPEYELDEEEARKAANGVPLSTANREPSSGEAVRLVHDGHLIAIAEPRSDSVKPSTVFR
jgi:tRNA pseudouridine55 synthase